MRKLGFALTALTVLLTACPSTTGSTTPPPPVADTTAPTISLGRSIADDKGVVTLTASASDAVGVTKVEFYRAGTLVATDTQAPYTYGVDILNDERTGFTARAYDTAGNVGTSSVFDIVTQFQGVWNWTLTSPGGATVDSGQTVFFAEGQAKTGVLGFGVYTNAAQTKSGLSLMGPITSTEPLSVAFTLNTSGTTPTFYFIGVDNDKALSTVGGKATFQGPGAIVDTAGNITQEVNVTLTQTSALLPASTGTLGRQSLGTLKTSMDAVRSAALPLLQR